MDFWYCGLLKGPKSFTVKFFCSLGGPLISDREECPPLVLVNFLISVLNITKLFSKSLGGREVCSLTEAESCLPVFRLIIDFLPI